jgi:hypothetical protein
MFTETDDHIHVDDFGYCVIHAKKRAEETGKTLRVYIPVESYDEDEANEQCW